MADIHPVPSPGMVAATADDSAAPLDGSIAGKFDAATAAAETWQQGAAAWADSPQGAGEGGFSLPFSGDGAIQDWPATPDVPHQGP